MNVTSFGNRCNYDEVTLDIKVGLTRKEKSRHRYTGRRKPCNDRVRIIVKYKKLEVTRKDSPLQVL